jgi:acetylornithine deacetylase
MVKVVEALPQVRFTHVPRPDLPALPRLNVGSVIGGRGANYVLTEPPYVPDLCTAIVDVHFVPGQTVESIVRDIRAVLDGLKSADPQFRYEIEIPPPEFFKGRRRLVMEPVDVPKDAGIVQAVARSHETVTGRRPAKVGGALLPLSYSAGDASWLWRVGTECVYYGPAGGFQEPGPEGSYILIDEMIASAKVLALTALDLCSVA